MARLRRFAGWRRGLGRRRTRPFLRTRVDPRRRRGQLSRRRRLRPGGEGPARPADRGPDAAVPLRRRIGGATARRRRPRRLPRGCCGQLLGASAVVQPRHQRLPGVAEEAVDACGVRAAHCRGRRPPARGARRVGAAAGAPVGAAVGRLRRRRPVHRRKVDHRRPRPPMRTRRRRAVGAATGPGTRRHRHRRPIHLAGSKIRATRRRPISAGDAPGAPRTGGGSRVRVWRHH